MNDRLFPGLHMARGQPQRQRLLFLELSVLIIKATQCLQRKSGKKVGASHCLKEKLNKQTPAQQRLSRFKLASWSANSLGFGVFTALGSVGNVLFDIRCIF